MIITAKKGFCYFLLAKEDNTKLSMETEYTGLEDWHFYINDYLGNITDVKFEMLTHVNSKFLFYNINNYQNLIREETYLKLKIQL